MFQKAKINDKDHGRAYKMHNQVRMLTAQNESGSLEKMDFLTPNLLV